LSVDLRSVPIPSRMAKLPRDPRGYPIPANVLRDADGVAHFAINDVHIRARQIAEDRCPICDGTLHRGRWLVGGPLAAFHERGAFIDPPMHHECATYALLVCPYLAAPSYSKSIAESAVKRVNPGESYVATFVDPTTIPGRPKLFVLAMTVGQNIVDDLIVPQRPWRQVEYWQLGKRLIQREGWGLVLEALKAGVPAQREPRVIKSISSLEVSMASRIECPQIKAEGTMDGVPYDTRLANREGPAIHFWLGDQPSGERAEELCRYAAKHRDVVTCTYSDGEPTGYWAQNNF
jgi:hypothetical protein